jgi:muramoyltetrapeptide carboxypeptidase
MWKGMDPYTEENFWRLLTSTKKIGVLKNPADEPFRILNHGNAKGRLLGGNFSLVASVFGTQFLPELQKSILVLEDIEEAPHRIDRMLSQLLNAGILQRLAGLVLGHFTDCKPSDPNEPNLTVDEVLEDYSAMVKCPVMTHFQYGHIPRKLTVPIGLQAMIDTKRNGVTVIESAVV